MLYTINHQKTKKNENCTKMHFGIYKDIFLITVLFVCLSSPEDMFTDFREILERERGSGREREGEKWGKERDRWKERKRKRGRERETLM